MLKLEKTNSLTNDIIFIDGLWGTGKSIIAPIINGMEGVEKEKLTPVYEYLCESGYLNKISDDLLITFLRMYSDMEQYHNSIGREVNLKWSDLSGPKHNPNSLRYLFRLFGGEGDDYIEKINSENIALHLMSHIILPVSLPLFEAFGKRLKLIEMVRHPLYMVRHWHSYLTNFNSIREFTLSFNVDGKKVPWFASEWSSEYLDASDMDRVLLCIIKLYEQIDSILGILKEKKQEILVLSFESVVLETEDSMDRLEVFLGRSHHSQLKKLLKKQKIPRKTISDGRGYSSYGWVHSTQPEEKIYQEHIKFMEQSAHPSVLKDFYKLISEYNEKWPSTLTRFHRG